jgi:hypothetical protein
MKSTRTTLILAAIYFFTCGFMPHTGVKPYYPGDYVGLSYLPVTDDGSFHFIGLYTQHYEMFVCWQNNVTPIIALVLFIVFLIMTIWDRVMNRCHDLGIQYDTYTFDNAQCSLDLEQTLPLNAFTSLEGMCPVCSCDLALERAQYEITFDPDKCPVCYCTISI